MDNPDLRRIFESAPVPSDYKDFKLRPYPVLGNPGPRPTHHIGYILPPSFDPHHTVPYVPIPLSPVHEHLNHVPSVLVSAVTGSVGYPAPPHDSLAPSTLPQQAVLTPVTPTTNDTPTSPLLQRRQGRVPNASTREPSPLSNLATSGRREVPYPSERIISGLVNSASHATASAPDSGELSKSSPNSLGSRMPTQSTPKTTPIVLAAPFENPSPSSSPTPKPTTVEYSVEHNDNHSTANHTEVGYPGESRTATLLQALRAPIPVATRGVSLSRWAAYLGKKGSDESCGGGRMVAARRQPRGPPVEEGVVLKLNFKAQATPATRRERAVEGLILLKRRV